MFDVSCFAFGRKPIVYAGKALEWYGLRTAGDIDCLLHAEDFVQLARAVPDAVSEQGTVIRLKNFEFQTSVEGYTYEQLCPYSQDHGFALVLSPLLLLLLKALACEMHPRNQQDVVALARFLLRHLTGAEEDASVPQGSLFGSVVVSPGEVVRVSSPAHAATMVLHVAEGAATVATTNQTVPLDQGGILLVQYR